MSSLIEKVRLASKLAPQMGMRYVSYRVRHALETKAGILKRRFPVNPEQDLSWASSVDHLQSRPLLKLLLGINANRSRSADAELKRDADLLAEGTFTYFSNTNYTLDLDNPAAWTKNPSNGASFPMVHWSDVPDLTDELGDIKYVWEPSRFSHLITLIRDDYHNGSQRGESVFNQIESWLNANPINVGPNYKCSQEISLRVINWTFALDYFKFDINLTDDLWIRIQENIYWSLHHIYHHIDFSRIAVRNNHALTETLALWIGGIVYSYMPNVSKWSEFGKQWFEEELAYQIYEDGTYLQHSHNYQRVVVQLLTLGLRFGELNSDKLSKQCYERGGAMLRYLASVQQDSGWLPNYGSNDGALFFPWATQHYRDYRPQLDALARALSLDYQHAGSTEEGDWLGLPSSQSPSRKPNPKGENQLSFPIGGIYAYINHGVFASLKAQAYVDRPGQADNLHIDLWISGENVLRDQGTYRYNTDWETLMYFMGGSGHNAITVNDCDHMAKGHRFIWFDWTKEVSVNWNSSNEIVAKIEGFAGVGEEISVERTMTVNSSDNQLIIRDVIISNSKESFTLQQWWHPNPNWIDRLDFSCSSFENQVPMQHKTGYYSSHYGEKTTVTDVLFTTNQRSLRTVISWL